MRRFLILASLALALPAAPAQAAELASCSATTPRIASPPNVPIPPNNVPMWVPWSANASCFKSFTTTTAGNVTALVDPDPTFVGIVGLRVRGPNALYFQFEGTYVGGDLVSGQASNTVPMPAGSWQLEVYLGGTPITIPNTPPIPPQQQFRTGFLSIGTYRGSVSN